jgi:preprotein translocase subunit SecG
MVEDGQSTENSSATDDNVKTDYRLSLPSSSQIHTCRLNMNSNISERRKKFLSRIITIVAIFLLVVCILLVTLTLRLAHKIDELVRLKQLMPKPNTFLLVSSSTTTTTTTTTATTDNFTHRRRTQSSFLTTMIN